MTPEEKLALIRGIMDGRNGGFNLFFDNHFHGPFLPTQTMPIEALGQLATVDNANTAPTNFAANDGTTNQMPVAAESTRAAVLSSTDAIPRSSSSNHSNPPVANQPVGISSDLAPIAPEPPIAPTAVTSVTPPVVHQAPISSRNPPVAIQPVSEPPMVPTAVHQAVVNAPDTSSVANRTRRVQTSPPVVAAAPLDQTEAEQQKRGRPANKRTMKMKWNEDRKWVKIDEGDRAELEEFRVLKDQRYLEEDWQTDEDLAKARMGIEKETKELNERKRKLEESVRQRQERSPAGNRRAPNLGVHKDGEMSYSAFTQHILEKAREKMRAAGLEPRRNGPLGEQVEKLSGECEAGNNQNERSNNGREDREDEIPVTTRNQRGDKGN